MKDRDRYLKIVEWSEEDKCYVGSVPGWIGACCHGDNEEKVYHQLCRTYGKRLTVEFHRAFWDPCPGVQLDREDLLELLYRESPYPAKDQ